MSHRWGTDIRRGIDTKALSEALARPGTDLRYWVSHGTVGVQDDAGNFDVQNPNSIWIGPEGVECDVRLEPLMIHVCCRFAGISGGDVTAYPPIHPGDQVLVTLPEGFAHLPVIVAVMNSRACKQPLDDNQVPIFDNKRLLIYAKTADIDIRTAGGAQLLMEQDGNIEAKNDGGADVKLGADGSIDVKTSSLITLEGDVPAVDFVAKGTAQNAQLITAFNELSKAMTAIGSAFSSIPAPCPECATAATVMSDVAAALPTTLSTIAKVGA
jgi:hypothetical protein